MERSLRDMSKANPSDEALKKDYHDFQFDRVTKELEHFEASPTPTRRSRSTSTTSRSGISSSRSSTRRSLATAGAAGPEVQSDASLYLGRAFFETQFLEEANETLDQLIADYQLKGDEKSKEMYYWRGRVLEAREIFGPGHPVVLAGGPVGLQLPRHPEAHQGTPGASEGVVFRRRTWVIFSRAGVDKLKALGMSEDLFPSSSPPPQSPGSILLYQTEDGRNTNRMPA